MEPKQNQAANMISQGVETLIERLKQDGVNAGKEEAARLISEAQEKANTILNNAQTKSKAMMDEAHQVIQQEKRRRRMHYSLQREICGLSSDKT